MSEDSQVLLRDQFWKIHKSLTRRRVDKATGPGLQKFMTALSFCTRAHSPAYTVIWNRTES